MNGPFALAVLTGIAEKGGHKLGGIGRQQIQRTGAGLGLALVGLIGPQHLGQLADHPLGWLDLLLQAVA